LIFNNEIFGAVELASFSEIVNYKIKFIEKIGESIASTLATVKINITTARLLEETKLKSEEMASQEEEIRQNMEEMISSQEELNAKSNGLTEIIDAIQSVIYFVEYNMQGKITDINEKYLEILHKRKEDIVGKFQGSFGLELQNIQFFNDFWDQLRAGKVRYYDQDLLIENKIVTISSTYIPILDQDRIPHKVISIASIK